MKRTAEIIVGIIGAAMDAFMAIIGIILLIILSSGFNWTEAPILTGVDIIHNILFVFTQLLWIPVVSCVISFILGLLGIVTVKRNTKLAGGFFIAAAVISSWLLFSVVAFQSLLYLAAGLMCFFRKPNTDQTL